MGIGMRRTHGVAIAVIAVGAGLLLLWMLFAIGSSRRTPGALLTSGQHVPAEKLPTPLAARVDVHARRGTVVFLFRLADAEGREIRDLRLAAGRPEPPKVEVLDARGKRVYACTLQYG